MLSGELVAIAEKLSALRTESYFQERAARGDRKAFRRILNKAGTEAPRAGDERPASSKQPQPVSDRSVG